ncbi:muscle M-line assembly protein unc-89-like [Battus philenor]|uniref:muscle M-line assembly protein unc-89-like n=1 Tax=Battus philenor TaxID=42288 RepID=UPI0035CFC6BA
MLPSMPILFARESQDAFGNKIEPSTSCFGQNSISKTAINPEPPPQNNVHGVTPIPKETEVTQKEVLKKKNSPPKLDENALEKAIVRSYYRKVQLRFATNSSVPTNKFVQFQELLKTFDPSKETPTDLYRKVEQLFGDENKDIVEEFLLFLKPGQAAEVGRFMDHFMFVQITNFIDKLQTTFTRKPTVLRKILRAITTGLNSGSSEEMKARVLPHLRSNPRLTQMFKSLFPDERPPDSAYENSVDVLDEKFLTADRGYDVWEFGDKNGSKRKLEVKENIDTVYLQGRVFLQHGRILRSASVTYPYSKEPYRVHARRLAPTHCHLSPPESDNETSSPKRNSKNTCKIPTKRTKKQLKSPTKNIKDVNDNTKQKECTVSIISKSMKAKSVPKNKSNITKDKKELEIKENKREKKERLDVRSQTCPKKEEMDKVRLTKIDAAAVKAETKSWTRDEDKTMLQVLKGEAGSEQVFGRIKELLPHRSATEIKERFCHVMNLLQQMAVGEVT